MGHQMLRIAYEQILSKASIQERNKPSFKFIRDISNDIEARTKRESTSKYRNIWRNLADKWMFTYEHFNTITNSLNCSVNIIQLHDHINQFSRHTKNILKDYAKLDPNEYLPSWAFEILNNFDNDYFSEEGLRALPIEACIVVFANC